MKNAEMKTPTHYDSAIQPLAFIEANHLTFSEGCIIKYVCRHRQKNGRADLVKAAHYLQMLMDREYPA
jgi:hypothetical protein